LRKSQGHFRVVVHGLTYFCRKLPGLLGSDRWDVRDHSQNQPSDFPAFLKDLYSCDLAYGWGGRISMGKFLRVARGFGKKKLVMLWSGSDVLFAKEQLASRKIDPWIQDRVHWAVSLALAEEVRSLGLVCEYVQASFVNLVDSPRPLPDRFSVLVYMPSVTRADLYGRSAILEVAEALPSVQFDIVGLQPGESLSTPSNVKTHEWVTDVRPFIEAASVIWRPVRHDAGTSFMVLEALANGRHVVYTYRHPGCIQAATPELARKELDRLAALHGSGALTLNVGGMEYVEQNCSRERVRKEILKRWEEIILSRDPLPGSGGLIRHAATDSARELVR
jgi:hypothetical protein